VVCRAKHVAAIVLADIPPTDEGKSLRAKPTSVPLKRGAGFPPLRTQRGEGGGGALPPTSRWERSSRRRPSAAAKRLPIHRHGTGEGGGKPARSSSTTLFFVADAGRLAPSTRTVFRERRGGRSLDGLAAYREEKREKAWKVCRRMERSRTIRGTGIPFKAQGESPVLSRSNTVQKTGSDTACSEPRFAQRGEKTDEFTGDTHPQESMRLLLESLAGGVD